MAIYGYARISTDIQDLTRQKTELIANGVAEENIFIDIGTGKNFNRIQLRKLVDNTIKLH